MSGEYGVVLSSQIQDQERNTKEVGNGKHRLKVGSYYWASESQDIFRSEVIQGPFSDESAAVEAAYFEITTSSQLILPNVEIKQHFVTGCVDLLDFKTPGFAEDYIDVIRDAVDITDDPDIVDREEVLLGDWFCGVSGCVLDALDDLMKETFYKWINQNSLDLPFVVIKDLKVHEV